MNQRFDQASQLWVETPMLPVGALAIQPKKRNFLSKWYESFRTWRTHTWKISPAVQDGRSFWFVQERIWGLWMVRDSAKEYEQAVKDLNDRREEKRRSNETVYFTS